MRLLSALSRPRLPRNAFLLDATEAAAVEVRRRGPRFAVSGAAFEPLPEGLLNPAFDASNVPNEQALAAVMDRVADAAGLAGRQRWSVLLPEAALKTVSFAFDTVPASRAELDQMIAWKTKNMVGLPADELRISRQLVVGGRAPRFLVVAVRTSVIEEYESLFRLLGWKVGVLAPRYYGEAAWLDWDRMPGDKLVVGARGGECTASFVRSGELLFVRPLDSDPERLDDEVFRLALYYRDRLADSPEGAALARVVACGGVDGERIAGVVAEALGSTPAVLNPVPDFITVDGPAESFGSVTAAAGIATQAWAG